MLHRHGVAALSKPSVMCGMRQLDPLVIHHPSAVSRIYDVRDSEVGFKFTFADPHQKIALHARTILRKKKRICLCTSNQLQRPGRVVVEALGRHDDRHGRTKPGEEERAEAIPTDFRAIVPSYEIGEKRRLFHRHLPLVLPRDHSRGSVPSLFHPAVFVEPSAEGRYHCYCRRVLPVPRPELFLGATDAPAERPVLAPEVSDLSLNVGEYVSLLVQHALPGFEDNVFHFQAALVELLLKFFYDALHQHGIAFHASVTIVHIPDEVPHRTLELPIAAI